MIIQQSQTEVDHEVTATDNQQLLEGGDTITQVTRPGGSKRVAVVLLAMVVAGLLVAVNWPTDDKVERMTAAEEVPFALSVHEPPAVSPPQPAPVPARSDTPGRTMTAESAVDKRMIEREQAERKAKEEQAHSMLPSYEFVGLVLLLRGSSGDVFVVQGAERKAR